MGSVLRAVGVLGVGVVVALLLAWVCFVVWFAEFGLGGHGWDDVEGTWVRIARLVALALHLLWLLAWAASRWAGPARWVAAGLLLPTTGITAWTAVALAVSMGTDPDKGWSLGAGLLHPHRPLVHGAFAGLLLVMAVVALAMLVGTRVGQARNALGGRARSGHATSGRPRDGGRCGARGPRGARR